MPAYMTLKKPARGTATKARRARKRAADAILDTEMRELSR